MTIKRREFLKAGAATATVAGAAGVVGLAGSSCGGLFEGNMFETGRVSLPEMDSYLKRLDRGLDFISNVEWREDAAEIRRREGLHYEDELGRKNLRSLFVAGMFGDLPDAGQVHPGMQARVRRALPEMDEALDETIEYLSTVSDEQVAGLQRYLTQHDNPGMAIAERLASHTAAAGVSTSRRLQMRSMVTQIVSRLKNQPPRLVFDEYIGKVRKQAALAGTVAEAQRYLAAQIGEEAFWERQQRMAMLSARWQDEGAADDLVLPDAPPVEVEPDAGVEETETDAGPTPVVGEERDRPTVDSALEAERAKLRAELVDDSSLKVGEAKQSLYLEQGDRRIRRGGWVLGIGGVTTAAGAVLACTYAWPVGAGLGTVAAILLTVGVIMIAVGAGDRARGEAAS